MNRNPITPRIMLVIIAAMFLLPLILAWLMYTGTLEFSPGSTRNQGTLVEPPVHLDWFQAVPVPGDGVVANASDILLEHWVVLHPLPLTCDADCQNHLVSLRQVHLASGRLGSRIRLAVLVSDAHAADTAQLVSGIYDQFAVVKDASGALFETTREVAAAASQQGGTYLVDPLGNIMMFYATDADPNDLKKDLKQLLTWSKLDEQ